MAMESLNPATGKVLKTFAEIGAGELNAKIDRAEGTFADWRKTSFEERARLMKNAASHLRDNSRKIAELAVLEMGKPLSQSIAEVEKCALVCDYYAGNAERHLSPRFVETDAHQSYVRCDPLGIILAVMPWNFPFWQVFRFAAPALMAGNVGLLKHASNVPQCALAIEDIFRAAGFPEGALTTLLISGKTAEGVVRDPRVKAVTLTGSEQAGKKVAAAAGDELKKCVLELGGSDPFIVLADADIDRAAKVAAQARNINAGQSCIAAKRFIVVESVADAFERRFLESLSAIVPGDPMRAETEIGPLARDDIRVDLQKQVDSSVGKGARVLLGGRIPEGEGYYYPVTLLTDVSPGMAVFDEETFGPVAALVRARDEEDAVRLANLSPYGLGSSLWTKNLERANRIAPLIEAGSVFVNGMVKSDPRLPFGGIKLSGYGRELSEEGIREFVNIKTVWMAE